MTKASPQFSQYVELAGRYAKASGNLPTQTDLAPVKTVICLQVMGIGIAIPLDETAELLNMPQCTRLPRVRSWVRGVANVRGKLLPVIDLADFLGGHLLTPPSQQRIVILDVGDLYVGLQVDAIAGMRHFGIDDYDAGATSSAEALQPFIAGAFIDGDTCWFLLRPLSVVEDPRFMDVSI